MNPEDERKIPRLWGFDEASEPVELNAGEGFGEGVTKPPPGNPQAYDRPWF